MGPESRTAVRSAVCIETIPTSYSRPAYIAFTRPSEFLYVTYPSIDEKGSAIPRSQFVGDLESLFDDLKEESIAEGRFLPVILITGKEDLNSKIEGLEVSRADDYIIKPFHTKELIARIRVMLRILDAQKYLLENERLKVLFEMAGAAAHELNQPLCAISCYMELLNQKMNEDRERHADIAEEIEGITESVDRISKIVHRISAIKRYSTKHYLYDEHIIDLEMSSGT